MKEEHKKTITQNRKARHDYFIIETFEAGIALTGPEVKSLRNGRANLTDSYGKIEREEIFLANAHISAYDQARQKDYNPTRQRKLLLHKVEIKKLSGRVKERGLTIVPLELYFKNGKAKVALALAKGKKTYDKRETLRKRAVAKDMQRALRGKTKGG
ncbi:MAG: SsrA-binding protein SmpB [bacterium]